MCPVLGIATGVSSTEGAKEDVSAVATEIMTRCPDGFVSRTSLRLRLCELEVGLET